MGFWHLKIIKAAFDLGGTSPGRILTGAWKQHGELVAGGIHPRGKLSRKDKCSQALSGRTDEHVAALDESECGVCLTQSVEVQSQDAQRKRLIVGVQLVFQGQGVWQPGQSVPKCALPTAKLDTSDSDQPPRWRGRVRNRSLAARAFARA
jgi:hypothetical protein